MVGWPNVVVSDQKTGDAIHLSQTDVAMVECEIVEPSLDSRTLVLTNCTASADCTKLLAQTKVMFFDVGVSVLLVAGAMPSVIITAMGSNTQHFIAQADLDAAVDFVKACALPPLALE
jgi:hypothetical protein